MEAARLQLLGRVGGGKLDPDCPYSLIPMFRSILLNMVSLVLLPVMVACGAGEPAREESRGDTASPPQATDGEPGPESRTDKSPKDLVQTKPQTRGLSLALSSIILTIEGYASDELGTRLSVLFENTSDDRFGLLPSYETKQFVLVDQDGVGAQAVTASASLLGLRTRGGIPPKARHRIWLLFAVDPGGFGRATDTWALEIPGFDAIDFVPATLPTEIAGTPDSTTANEQLTALNLASTRAPATVGEPIKALLDAHADALERLDYTGYLKTFVSARRNEERSVLDRLRQLDLDQVSLEAIAPPEPGSDASSLRVRALLRYNLAELRDHPPFVDPWELLIRDEDGTPRIMAIRPSRRSLSLWRDGPLELYRTHHFLLLSRPPASRHLDQLAREAETAYLKVLQRGLDLGAKYLAILVPTEVEFASLTNAPSAFGAARTDRFLDSSSKSQLANQAMLINDQRFARTRATREQTLAHELVHLALANLTSPQTPPWLREGAAVYYSDGANAIGGQRLVRVGLDQLSLAALDREGALAEHSRLVGYGYLYAGTVVDHLVRHGGNERFIALYRSSRLDEGGTEPDMQRLYGFGLDELDRRVKEQLRLASL